MCPKIKSIKALIVVLDTCRNDEGQSKNESTHNITPIIVYGDFFQTFKGS